MKRIASLGGLALLALMGMGCNPFAGVQEKIQNQVAESVTEGIIKKNTGVDVDIDNGTGGVTYTDPKTGNTGSFGQDVKIPENFPSDVPRYPNGKTVMVSVAEAGKQASLTQTTTDEPAKAQDWVETELKARGYTQESSTAAGGGVMMAYRKDKVQLGVYITAPDGEEGQTTLLLTRQEQAAE